MSYDTSAPMKDQGNKSSVESGVSNKEMPGKILGGYPEKKSIEQIDKQNSPKGRSRAPGSVRV